MRVLLALTMALFISGCSVATLLFTCPDCTLNPEDASFQPQDPEGLLAFGLTVDASLKDDDPLTGSIEWLLESPTGVVLRNMTFPKDLAPGQHRLILWKVPAGTWSLRNAQLDMGGKVVLSPVLTYQTAATAVNPGRITIAGEIHIQEKAGALSLSRGLEPAFVRKMMQSYPEITAPSDEMPLVDLRKHPTLNKHTSSH